MTVLINKFCKGLNSYIYIIIWNQSLNNELYDEINGVERFNFLRKFLKISGKFSHIIYVYIPEEIEEARLKTIENLALFIKFPEKFILKMKETIWLYIYISKYLNSILIVDFSIYFEYYFKEKLRKLKNKFFLNYDLLILNTIYKKILFIFYKIV